MFSYRFSVLCLYFSAIAGITLSPANFSYIAFDYIVVGGGSTGLALATRLSDNPLVTVGVIDAGLHIEDDNILIPGKSRLIGSTLADPEYDWMFVTNPQIGLNQRELGLGRGKVLGGTAALNFMAHTRGSVNEYNGWGDLGNPGWDFATVQEYIQKSERWTPPTEIAADEFHANNDTWDHGRFGTINTTSYTFYTDIVLPFFDAFNSLGVTTNEAANGGDTLGVWTITGSVDALNRSRSFSTTAYYDPNALRSNLIVLEASRVLRVVLDETLDSEGLVIASGVEYLGSDNATYTAHAQREVILSAGAIQTPQLLELSGIGNTTILTSYGIPPRVDLPGVGENLQDHPGLYITFRTQDNLTTLDDLNDPQYAAEQMREYKINRTGMYSSTTSTIALLRMDETIPAAELDSILLDLDNALASDSRLDTTSYKMQRSWMNDYTIPHIEYILFPGLTDTTIQAQPGQKFFAFNILYQHSWSRGTVHINSSDPIASPVVDPRYLDSPGNIDLQVFIAAVKFAYEIAATDPLKSIITEVYGPGSNASDVEYIQYIRERLATNYHFIGTAAMLPREQGGVVDSTLKVYGTSNLRVADTSIFPLHIAAHPTATLYGIAERLAHILSTDL